MKEKFLNYVEFFFFQYKRADKRELQAYFLTATYAVSVKTFYCIAFELLFHKNTS